MGFKLTLKKENNNFYHNFVDAYWAIDGIALTTENGVFKVSCEIKCYPSREAKYKTGEAVETMTFGGSLSPMYNPLLYQFILLELATSVFGQDSIPTDTAQIKTAIYNYLKNNFTEFATAEDVFEES